MHITLSPVFAASRPYIARDGDALIIGSERFDFSGLDDGDVLPADAVASDLLIGEITRADGTLQLHMILTHGAVAGEDARFPDPVTVSADGPIGLPAYATGIAAPERPETITDGAIDWTRKRSAAQAAVDALAAKREAALVSRGDFAIRACLAGLITEAEAEAWAGGASLPQSIQTAFQGIADPAERLGARIEALTTPAVRRSNPLILMLQSALSLSDAQADALFGIE